MVRDIGIMPNSVPNALWRRKSFEISVSAVTDCRSRVVRKAGSPRRAAVLPRSVRPLNVFLNDVLISTGNTGHALVIHGARSPKPTAASVWDQQVHARWRPKSLRREVDVTRTTAPSAMSAPPPFDVLETRPCRPASSPSTPGRRNRPPTGRRPPGSRGCARPARRGRHGC